jgi:GTP-binding protein
MPQMPVVAIVGRPNVGKSSLLNALTGKMISIVQDMPGVTRDRVSFPLKVEDRYVELVDTGGYGFHDEQGLTEHIKHQIEVAMSRANLVLFLVDVQAGLQQGDQDIASLLRRINAKVLLIGNKSDGEKIDQSLGEFARLGFGTPVGVSALNNRNLDSIFEAIRKNIDLSSAPTTIPDPQLLVAIVGKRNAGKSTLVNAISRIYDVDDDRVIVSEIPGTTRDSVDVRFEKEGKTLVVIDTAGVRKKRHMVNDDIEFYSFHRAQRSVRRADVVILLLDAMEKVSEPDKKLAQYIAEQYKPVVIVVNKWDSARDAARETRNLKPDESLRDEDLMEEYGEYLRAEMPNLDYAPVAFITAKTGKNVQAVLDECQHLFKQANERLTTGRLNRAVRQILDERQPSTRFGRRARVYYATQVEVAPPTIVLVVNNPEYIDDGYQRFMLNRMRDLLPYPEVPIKLHIRERSEATKAGLKEPDLEHSSPRKPAKTRASSPSRPKAKGMRAKSNARWEARKARKARKGK